MKKLFLQQLFHCIGGRMAKAKQTTMYYCQNCGHESVKWMGQCPMCKEWNTFVEETVTKGGSGMGGAIKSG